jgi:hypothetical protein
MERQPQTWHHGLLAQWWAEFNVITPEELTYYRGLIEREGQPALDAACGAGRLLVPLLQAGLDVDGCEVDMLTQSRSLSARAARDAPLSHAALAKRSGYFRG